MTINRWLFLLMAGLSPLPMMAQSRGQAHDLRRNADRSYDQKKYDVAEDAYRRSTILDPDNRGTFNLGNAIFNQNRYDEAARQYEKAIDQIDDPKEKSKAWYNQGNAHYLNGKYDQSVNAYKRALIADPDDLQAKQNLLMALREMKLQEQQQQQDQEEQKQDQEKQENQPQDQQQENQDRQQEQQPSQNNSEEQQPQEELEQKLSKEQAMQLLEIIDEEDQKVQEKIRRKEAGEKKKDKDW